MDHCENVGVEAVEGRIKITTRRQHFIFQSSILRPFILFQHFSFISKLYSSSLYLVLAAGFSNKTSRYSCLVEGWVGKLVRHLIKTQTNIPTTLYGSQTMHLKCSQLKVFEEETSPQDINSLTILTSFAFITKKVS